MSINQRKLDAQYDVSQGVEIVPGTGSGTAGPWREIRMVAATTFSSITLANSTGTLTGVAFPANFVLSGDITAFTLTSGTCVAIKGKLVS